MKRICSRRRRLVLVALAGTALLCGAALLFPERWLCVDSGEASGEVMVILGGGSGERPVRGGELYKAGAAPRIIVSGEGDADYNREVLVRCGAPAAVIEVESESRTTKENAEFTVPRLRAMHASRVVLVTSWYHSRRALRTFQHTAPEIEFLSRPVPAEAGKRRRYPEASSRRVYLEYVKIPVYWLLYGISPW